MTVIKNDDGTWAITGLTREEIAQICSALLLVVADGDKFKETMLLVVLDTMVTTTPEHKVALTEQFTRLITKLNLPAAILLPMVREQMIEN